MLLFSVLGYFIAFALDFDAYSIKYAAISSVLVGLLLARPALRRRNVLTSVQFVHFALELKTYPRLPLLTEIYLNILLRQKQYFFVNVHEVEMSISVRVQNEYDYFDLTSDCDKSVWGGSFFFP